MTPRRKRCIVVNECLRKLAYIVGEIGLTTHVVIASLIATMHTWFAYHVYHRFPLCQFPIRQFPAHFVNSHLVNVDEVGIDKVGSWQSGNWRSEIDEVGIDEMGIDQMGINLDNIHWASTNRSPKEFSHFHFQLRNQIFCFFSSLFYQNTEPGCGNGPLAL